MSSLCHSLFSLQAEINKTPTGLRHPQWCNKIFPEAVGLCNFFLYLAILWLKRQCVFVCTASTQSFLSYKRVWPSVQHRPPCRWYNLHLVGTCALWLNDSAPFILEQSKQRTKKCFDKSFNILKCVPNTFAVFEKMTDVIWLFLTLIHSSLLQASREMILLQISSKQFEMIQIKRLAHHCQVL